MIIRLFERQPRKMSGIDLCREMAKAGVTEVTITRGFAAQLLYEQLADREPAWEEPPPDGAYSPDRLHDASIYNMLIKVEGVKE
jgi:hypothetical protein